MNDWSASGRLRGAALVALGQLVAGCAAAGDPASPAPAGAEPVWPAFAASFEAPDRAVSVERTSIGASAGGVEIPLYQLWTPGDVDPGERPAVLVVAGVDARHLVGHAAARDLISAVRDAEPAALSHATLYIVPMLNPDALERSGPLDAAAPGGTLTPRDADRDGRMDEDGPADLNGDGVITQIRIEDPPPGWGLRATKIIDPDEPRLMRDPKPEDGERATHAVLIEGRDIDGDGRIAEDGAGGVDLDRNFPYLWPEGKANAGVWALSEAESRALVDWMLERPNIYAVVTYGPHDTIVNIPQAGKFDQTGRVPTGIESGDKPTYERISKIFKEITHQTGAPTGDNKGSFQGWAYGHFGALSVSTPVWVRPDLVSDDADETEPAEAPAAQPAESEEAPAPQTITLAGRTITLTLEGVQAARDEMETMSEAEQQAVFAAFAALPAETQAKLQALMQGQEIGDEPASEGSGPPAKKKGDSDDAKWLAYSDERAGAGFVDWTPVDHPELGPVEVGGFVADFKLNPPDDAIPSLVEEQTEFIVRLLEMGPRLVIEEPTVEPLGAGLWRVSIRLRNDGELATRAAIGVKARRLPPIVVHIDADDDALVSGSRVDRVNAIGPHGETSDHEWIVRAAPGSERTITIRTEEWGDTMKTVRFEEGL